MLTNYIIGSSDEEKYNIDSILTREDIIQIDPKRTDGDNIAELNHEYSELTALYWIWKNDKTSEYISVNHYKRFLCENYFGKIITEEYIKIFLDDYNYDFLLPKEYSLILASTFEILNCTVTREEILLFKDILTKKYPEYLSPFWIKMAGNSGHYRNIMCCKKSEFDNYCELLFSILEDYRAALPIEHSPRILGYFAELFMDLYLMVNNKRHFDLNFYTLDDGMDKTDIQCYGDGKPYSTFVDIY